MSAAAAALPEDRNELLYALTVDVPLEPVPAQEVDAGEPQQGIVELGNAGNCEVGVWELRGGTVRDTEVDEIFVVLSGGATIELLDEGRSINVGAGDVMRLVAGTRTRWTVLDHIRKVYIAPE